MHAFFVNSGGIHLKSPDFPRGFPVDAQQLHYLIRHNFVEFPDLDSMDMPFDGPGGNWPYIRAIAL